MSSTMSDGEEVERPSTASGALRHRQLLPTTSSPSSPAIWTVRDIHFALNLTSPYHVNPTELERFISTAHLTPSPPSPSAQAFILLFEYIDAFLSLSTLLEKIPPVPSTYHLSETAHRAQCFTDFEPRQGPSLGGQILDLGQWTRNLSFFDVKGVEKAIAKGLGYLDRKYIYLSGGVESTLKLAVSVQHLSKIWLCEVPKGFLKYPSHMADLPDGATIQLVPTSSSSSPTTTPVVTTEIGKLNLFLYLCLSVSLFISRALPPSPLSLLFDHSPIDICMFLELELLLDQCYRSRQEIAPGDYSLHIKQKGDKQVLCSLFFHALTHSLCWGVMPPLCLHRLT